MVRFSACHPKQIRNGSRFAFDNRETFFIGDVSGIVANIRSVAVGPHERQKTPGAVALTILGLFKLLDMLVLWDCPRTVLYCIVCITWSYKCLQWYRKRPHQTTHRLLCVRWSWQGLGEPAHHTEFVFTPKTCIRNVHFPARRLYLNLLQPRRQLGGCNNCTTPRQINR